MTAVTAGKLARISGWLAIIVIIVLSVVPGNERPHTGASGHSEHFSAYLITATLLAFAYPHHTATIALGLPLLSGLLEIAQIFIPGRHAGFDDFVASSLGAGAGLVWSSLLLCWFRRA
jgi:VanZ family protein